MSYIFDTMGNKHKASSYFDLFQDLLDESMDLKDSFATNTISGKWDKDEDAYVFSLEFPGYSKKDFSVDYSNNDNSIKIFAKNDERGTKTRVVNFGKNTKYAIDKTKASVKNGMLYLAIPIKKTPDNYNKITVN